MKTKFIAAAGTLVAFVLSTGSAQAHHAIHCPYNRWLATAERVYSGVNVPSEHQLKHLRHERLLCDRPKIRDRELAVQHGLHEQNLTTRYEYVVWTRVADCESGGWDVQGSAYPDSLGITYTNYEDFGGAPQAPTSYVTMPDRLAQIAVAERLITAYGVDPPDQSGPCHDW